MVKVSIEYCNKCKWQNRAVWYMQELLQTFDGKITEISLIPNNDTPGTFKVTLFNDNCEKILYKKRMKKSTLPQDELYIYDGFPDSKFLKVLVRNEISPQEDLGHVDKYSNYQLTNCEDCQREQ